MTAHEFEIRDSRPLLCEFCDRKVIGRVRMELYGGALMVCEACLAALESKRAHPYSQVMDKFCLRACGYHINAKMARMSTSTSRPWFRHG